MNLLFHILWFDDKINEIKPFEDSLELFLYQYGFKLDIEKVDNISDETLNTISSRLKNYNPYDLVIFDYDFGVPDVNGVTAAEKVRRAIYTDIIFYSSNPRQLNDTLVKKFIYGSYIVNKFRFDHTIRPIIQDHIKKFTNINNIRGLILSEMSQIEILLRKKFLEYHNNTKHSFQECSLKELKINDINKTLTKLNNYVDDELISDPHNYTLQDLRVNYKRFLKHQNKECKILDDKGLLHEYQMLRNNFAHRLDEYDKNNGTVSLINPKTNEPTDFNFERFLQIRKGLHELKNQIETLPLSNE